MFEAQNKAKVKKITEKPAVLSSIAGTLLYT